MKLCSLHSSPNSNATEIGAYKKWAHHPDCYRYDHHLARPFGISVCLGCLGMGTGFLLGFLLYFFETWGQLNLWQNFLLSICLLLPAILQPHFQKRFFKFPSRLFLGLAIWIVLFGTILKNDWISGEGIISAIVIFLICFQIKKWVLNYRNVYSKIPCIDCPHGKYPLCSHYIDDIQKQADSENTAEGMREFYLTLIKQLRSENPNDGNLVEIESFNIKVENNR